jgi:hypothetical protein
LIGAGVCVSVCVCSGLSTQPGVQELLRRLKTKDQTIDEVGTESEMKIQCEMQNAKCNNTRRFLMTTAPWSLNNFET